MILRLIGSAVAGLMVSVLLFVFMLRLLAGEAVQASIDQAVTQMEFVDLPEPPPEPEENTDSSSSDQAQTQAVDSNDLVPAMPLAPASPTPPQTDMAQPDWQDLALNVPAPASRWTVPAAGETFNAGQKGKGYVEVVPLATRRPNIPERAWRHKIDGWVLVAFTLKPDGRTADVRVLDAQPGGVFEDSVIKAVEDWLYDMRDLDHKGDIILTQKIELFWRDYPDNSPYLD